VVTAISVVLVAHRSDQNQRRKGILPRLQLEEVHQRPWGATKRGLASHHVPVLTALDNAGGVSAAILLSLSVRPETF
jgi:hypothetical protein